LHAVQKRHDNSKTLQLLADELIQHENLKEINMQVIMGKSSTFDDLFTHNEVVLCVIRYLKYSATNEVVILEVDAIVKF
jgi:hypothetical protein